jgi:hypothetical protein
MMRLYFAKAELLLEKVAEEYVLTMAAEELGRFKQEKKAVTEYNRIRRDLEAKLPPTELSEEDRRVLLGKFLADGLVGHNSMRAEIRKKPAKSRTFG